MGEFLFGVAPIRALWEASSPFLDAFFVIITSTGDVLFFLAVVVLVYWLWDKRFGLFLGSLLLVSGALNGLLKTLFGLPRPPSFFHRPFALASNGFPSGHAQTATAFWSGIALVFRGGWVLAAVVMTALVAFSRVYLGVHFVGDVLGGVAIGLGLGLAGVVGFRASFWSRLTVSQQLILAVLLPAALGGVLLALGEAPYLVWGLLTGLSVGYVLEGEWVGMMRPGSADAGALRIGLGILVVGGLASLGLSLSDPFLVLPFFVVLGLTVSLVLPWAFVRLERAVLRANR
ncbi:MAG: phosphatase PAP2 family protein [Candidatus Thermoplasmatota archaeon]|nr:phosphatase PAP2 family protein [Candidatus Thermoplasmatota archaeon]